MTGSTESTTTNNISLELLAKRFVYVAFRNGEIENVHDHISQNEMRDIMRDAVNKVYTLFKIANEVPDEFLSRIQGMFDNILCMGADHWDEPQRDKDVMILRRFLELRDPL